MASTNGTTTPQPQTPSSSRQDSQMSIINALGHAFKNQTGEPMQHDKIASLLLANMNQLSELAKQGKLNETQIRTLKEFADKNKHAAAQAAAAAQQTPGGSKVAQPLSVLNAAAMAGFKSSSPAPVLSSTTGESYHISQDLNTVNPGPLPMKSAQQGRPTLTGGIIGGRVSGTPAQVARAEGDAANAYGSTEITSRRKTSPNDQSMRRSIQDLVSSIDPNVKIEPEVEDLLLDIADEFIDSVTNFSCHLARHRGGEALEVRDLQLHLERNHNIRIPGFASDETRISISQSALGPATGIVPTAGGSSNKKGAQATHMTLRSQRLAQVSQAKKDAKLL